MSSFRTELGMSLPGYGKQRESEEGKGESGGEKIEKERISQQRRPWEVMDKEESAPVYPLMYATTPFKILLSASFC
jgi:hypothetical protein